MSGQRSRKDLACTADATAHQRQFVADLKRRVIDDGEPFAIAQADTPHEIFHALDIWSMTLQEPPSPSVRLGMSPPEPPTQPILPTHPRSTF